MIGKFKSVYVQLGSGECECECGLECHIISGDVRNWGV